VAEEALDAGEVVGVAVVAGGEGVSEYVRVAQVLGDLGERAEPCEQVLGDVVGRSLAEAGVGAVAATAELLSSDGWRRWLRTRSVLPATA
jgi:hypothetical protein